MTVVDTKLICERQDPVARHLSQGRTPSISQLRYVEGTRSPFPVQVSIRGR